MFEHLQPLSPDPILGLMARFREDRRPDRIDLGVGVYRDANGRTPIMRAVSAAERMRLDEEDTKAYQGMLGDPAFTTAIQTLALGAGEPALCERLATVQTPGGTAALRVAADLIHVARPAARIWLADPSWDNHAPIFRAAGISVLTYPYLDAARTALREDAMLDALESIPAGDAVLFQVSCHNPSGVDIPAPTWARIADIALRRGFLPLLDMAYQGLGDGLDADATGLRTLAARVPELLLANSCSKNFGLYRERTGALTLLATSAAQARAAQSVLLQDVRALYSMPPAHGAAIVARVLQRSALRAPWEAELASMRAHIQRMRQQLAAQMRDHGHDFDYLLGQRGMFSFLNLPAGGAQALREQHAIYVLDSGRINLAGLTEATVARVAVALQTVGKAHLAQTPAGES